MQKQENGYIVVVGFSGGELYFRGLFSHLVDNTGEAKRFVGRAAAIKISKHLERFHHVPARVEQAK